MTEGAAPPLGTKIALLDVGHGNCAVVSSGSEAVVIDCPPTAAVVDYLHLNRVTVVSDLIISHSHKDHFGGVADLIEAGIDLRRIWFLDDQRNPTDAYLYLRAQFV